MYCEEKILRLFGVGLVTSGHCLLLCPSWAGRCNTKVELRSGWESSDPTSTRRTDESNEPLRWRGNVTTMAPSSEESAPPGTRLDRSHGGGRPGRHRRVDLGRRGDQPPESRVHHLQGDVAPHTDDNDDHNNCACGHGPSPPDIGHGSPRRGLAGHDRQLDTVDSRHGGHRSADPTLRFLKCRVHRRLVSHVHHLSGQLHNHNLPSLTTRVLLRRRRLPAQRPESGYSGSLQCGRHENHVHGRRASRSMPPPRSERPTMPPAGS